MYLCDSNSQNNDTLPIMFYWHDKHTVQKSIMAKDCITDVAQVIHFRSHWPLGRAPNRHVISNARPSGPEPISTHRHAKRRLESEMHVFCWHPHFSLISTAQRTPLPETPNQNALRVRKEPTARWVKSGRGERWSLIQISLGRQQIRGTLLGILWWEKWRIKWLDTHSN